MKNSAFDLFTAKERAENYVKGLYKSTCTVSAVVHVAVDPAYRCLSVPETGNERKLAEQQSTCIFRVKYDDGTAIVNYTEFVSDKLMSDK
jgi:hypothetical protein